MQKLSLSAVISRSLTALKDNFAAFFMISTLMKVITLLLMMAFGFYDLMQSGMMSPADLIEGPGGMFGSYTLIMLATIAPSILALGILTPGTVAYLQGNPTTIGDCVKQGMQKSVPLILLGLIIGFGVSLGMMLLIIPGLIVFSLWFVAGPVLMVERTGIMNALTRSIALTNGARGIIIALVALIFFASLAVSSITLFLVASFGIIGSVILTALDGIFLAFGCIVCVVVYMDLRKAT
ncbi:MAG: hypothetical protein P1V34_03300 [Alphaproteobacteria bacterium]|nr:hypothetical protein [Alphaproteobacteria bacterium]